MIEVAFLAAHLLGFVTEADQRLLLELVTTRAADVLHIAGHRIAIGNPANLCIHESQRVVDLLREHQRPRWVVSRGRVVAESWSTTTLDRRS
jgi:cytosine deaminase